MEDLAMVNATRPAATNKLPLLGVTILLIEDSRYCSEAMRLLAIRSGARLRRANSIKAAKRHLRIYRPDVVMVDFGLPDGSGIEVIKEIKQGQPPFPAIIGISGNSGTDEQDQAKKAGAQFFIEKPIFDLAQFQQSILQNLPDEMGAKKFTPRLAGTFVMPDMQALKDDFVHIKQLMDDCFKNGDKTLLAYIAQFLASLGREIGSKKILTAARKISLFATEESFSKSDIKQEFDIVWGEVNSRVAQS